MNASFLMKKKHKQLRKGILVKDDIVLTTRGSVGNVALFDSTVPFNVIRINSGMVLLRNPGTTFNTEFLYTLFRSHLFEKQLDKYVIEPGDQ